MSAQTQTLLGILGFLGTVALVGIGVLAAIAFAVAGRVRVASIVAAGTVAVVALYAVALLGAGLLGRTRVLAPGAAKVFCEIDCHLAYDVAAVHVAPGTAGPRYLVTVRTRFDARTIAPWRGDGLLWPNPRRVRLVDARGHAWSPAAAAGTPLDTPLRPGQSYETTFAFDLPAAVDAPRLELTEAGVVTRLLVGHENSPLHGKTLLHL
jgi:hypothetical protein